MGTSAAQKRPGNKKIGNSKNLLYRVMKRECNLIRKVDESFIDEIPHSFIVEDVFHFTAGVLAFTFSE